MSTPISDRLEHELGVVIQHGRADVQRVWRDITGHNRAAHYDSVSDQKETPVSVLDTIRTDLEGVLDKAEQDAAKVARYESEPLVRDILIMLETLPDVRDVLTPVVAGIGKLASMAPAAPAPAAETTAAPEPPADAAIEPQPAGQPDPQIQTGVAQ